MKIDISPEDLGTLCICALRYCHGRMTYMPSTVQRIVLSLEDKLSKKDRYVILEDKKFQKRMELWGMDCDKMDWLNFYERFEKKDNELSENNTD